MNELLLMILFNSWLKMLKDERIDDLEKGLEAAVMQLEKQRMISSNKI